MVTRVYVVLPSCTNRDEFGEQRGGEDETDERSFLSVLGFPVAAPEERFRRFTQYRINIGKSQSNQTSGVRGLRG